MPRLKFILMSVYLGTNAVKKVDLLALLCVTSSCDFVTYLWRPRSGVVLDCIDS